jgi:hypothetical protein
MESRQDFGSNRENVSNGRFFIQNSTDQKAKMEASCHEDTEQHANLLLEVSRSSLPTRFLNAFDRKTLRLCKFNHA